MFRELMMFDFYAPDHYFSEEALLRKRQKKQARQQFVIPLKTFWRPIEFEEYYETDLTNPRFFKNVNAVSDAEQKIGQFLAKPLRDAILKQDKALVNKLREGGTETALREHATEERSEQLVFEKYSSIGLQRLNLTLDENKRLLEYKTSKKAFEADVPFDFLK